MATDTGPDNGQEDEPPSPPNRSHVSPETSEHYDAKESEQFHPEQPIKGTIHLARQNSTSDSDSGPMAPPAHQFVSYPSNIYDSDASDGSIVFNYPETPPSVQQRKSSAERERFPSFDSLASTGSFRVIPGSSQSQQSPYRVAPQQQQQQPQPPPQPTPVQLLPYAQRRKLLAEREEQNKEHQPDQSNPPQMVQMPMQYPPMQPNQYGHPRQQQQQMPHYPAPPPMDQYGMPYMMPPPPGAMPMMGGMPPPPPPHMMAGPPPPMGMPLQNPNAAPVRQSSGRKTPPPPGQQQQRQNMPPIITTRQPDHGKRKPQLHHSLPPSGPRGRASSTDSTDFPPPPPKPQRRDGAPLPPPPPPPPPPMSQYHIRADSSGSISSIGSTGSRGANGMMTLTDRLGNDIAGYLQEEETPNGNQKEPQSDGFFSFLQLSPGSRRQQQQSGVSVEEFHRRNQQFLLSSEQERARIQKAMRDSSPRRQQVMQSPRSHRPGLSSIDGDNWEEDSPDGPPASHRGRTVKHGRESYGEEQQPYSFDPYNVHYERENVARVPSSRRRSPRTGESSSDTGSAMSSSFDASDDDFSSMGEEATERTSLLPPSGIGTGESREAKESYTNEVRSGRRDSRGRKSRDSHRPSRRESERWNDAALGNRRPSQRETERRGNTRQSRNNDLYHEPYNDPVMNATERRENAFAGRKSRKKGRKKSRRRRHRDDDVDLYRSSSSHSSSHVSTRRQMRILEKERTRLIAQWKAEALAEAEVSRKQYEANRWDRKLGECLESTCTPCIESWMKAWTKIETFIANLPLTVGAIALAIVTLGVVWFKFAEENLDSCQPVHFHSSQCTFPEFPGCFYCDKTVKMYKVALNFHFSCSIIAGILAAVFLAKVFLATRVVLDEMSSPTTASPAGLICMTLVMVFAGRGLVGQVIVSAAATLHLCLAIWFIYMALAYHIMPEPSWYPNTVGIGISAVKMWLYYPMPGHLLMAVSLSLNFFFFPISLVRVFLNQKMSAPATWIQMSAPAVSLYALTIMAQPSFIEEHPDVTHFQKVHRMVYLPCMHVLFALAIVGMMSSIQSLIVRWPSFKTKAFSPAHAAFCFPTLAHANAVQAYRAAVNTFSDIPAKSPFKIALYMYWVAVLVSGTLATIYVTCKFMYHLPSWTQIDVADEEEPPAPNETALTLQHMVTTGETLQQPFVSPAVLQANETGALVMLPRRGPDGRRRYRRTRQLTALGFEPIMNIIEMDHELEVLLEYVAKHPPRRRQQTLSVPGIDFNYGFGDFGAGNTGVYDDRRHARSQTDYLGRTRANTVGDNPNVPWNYYGGTQP